MDRIIPPKRSLGKPEATPIQAASKNGQRPSVAEQLASVHKPAKSSSHLTAPSRQPKQAR